MTKRTYDEEIRQALARSHAGTPEVDLAATAWQGGRRRRTRRMLGTGTGVTALVAAAAAAAFALGGGLTPEAFDPGPAGAPEAVDAVGPGVAVDLPEGWTVVHRGELEEGVHTSCAVPQGRGTDPTVQCDGIEFTVGLGEEPGPAGTEFFRAGVDQPIPCYADPAWRDQDPAANPAEVEPAGGGGVQGGGQPDADTARWSGRCADGQRFYPESWWWADGGVLATSLTGDPAVEELALTLDFYADTGDLVTQDAVVGSMDGAEVALDVFEPGDGPVGSGATPTGSAAYRLTEQTQCHLHDLQGPSGLDLSIVDCAELLDWLAGEVSADREPLVTVIADEEDRLVQIRTLYTP